MSNHNVQTTALVLSCAAKVDITYFFMYTVVSLVSTSTLTSLLNAYHENSMEIKYYLEFCRSNDMYTDAK